MAAVTKKRLDNIVSGASVRDALGRKIHTTYSTKTELSAVQTSLNTLDGAAVKKANVVDNTTSIGVKDAPLSANQGYLLAQAIASIQALLQSDDTALDELQEVVNYIKNNKDLIDGITTSKVSVSDIIDNCTSEVSNKPLSAKQGKVLKGLIDALTTRVSDNEDDISANAGAISTNAGAISAEEARAKGEENAIKTRVTALENATPTYDSAMSNTSTNAVQNKVIYAFLNARGLVTVEDMSFDTWEA